MQTVTAALSTYRPESSAEPQSIATIPSGAVGALIRTLRLQLGAGWADKFPVPADPAKATKHADDLAAEWGRGLAGYQKHEIRRGLDRVSDYGTKGFAPTLPEFKRLCRPCLDPEWAWHEAQEGLAAREQGERGAWTHPAVFFAASSMATEVRSGDWQRHRTRWTRTLARELEHGWGREIPQPAMRLDYTQKVGPPPAEVRSNIERLLQEAREAAAAKRRQKQEQEEGTNGSGEVDAALPGAV
jgi:hypothetical protein